MRKKKIKRSNENNLNKNFDAGSRAGKSRWEVQVGSIPEIFRYNGCQSLAFDKVDSSSLKFIKEDTTAQVFSYEFSGVF